MNILLDEILENGVHKWSGTSYEKEWTLFCGDAVDALRNVPDECVHCIVTSPPYYSLRDYGVDGQIGLEDTVNEYITSLCSVMDQLAFHYNYGGFLYESTKTHSR